MFKYFSESISLLKKSMRNLIIFEIVFTFLSLLVIVPVMGFSVNAAIKLAGLKYLTSYNIVRFLKVPTTWFVFLFLIVFLVFYMLIEISAVIHCFANVRENKQVTCSRMMSVGFSSVKKIFKKNNFLILFYVLLFIPFTQIVFVSSTFSYIGIPDFLSYYINQKWIIFAAFAVLVAVSVILSGRSIYIIHNYVLLHQDFKKARKTSRIISKKERLKNALFLILWNILIYAAILFILVILFVLPVTVLQKTISSGYVSKVVLISLKTLFKAFILIFTLFSVPVNYSFITVRYFKKLEKNDLNKIIVKNDNERIKTKRKWITYAAFSIITAVVVVNGVFFRTGGFSSLNFSLFSTPQISAHRGYSSAAPENTEYAFQAAIDCGADYIELDVQETKDGEIVVMHDSNLKRTSGVNADIWNVNYSEISGLDIGSWFGDEFSDAKIMKLEDVIKMAGNKIKLNIEIKPTGHENLIVEKTASLISKYEFENRCCVTSFSYDIIRKIKQINPDIKTALTLSVAYGNIGSLEYADAVSVNQLFVTKRLVSTCHNNGKKVFAWTADKSAEIQKLSELNVDNIITDYPEKAMKITYSVYTGDTIFSVLRFLTN